MKKLIYILVALSVFAGNAFAHHHVNAVIHNYSCDVKVTSAGRCSYTCRQKVEMLNDNAQRYGMIVFPLDANRELSRFSATLRDEFGNVIRTVKTSDLAYDDQSTSHLSSDIYYKVCEILPPAYPATLEYEYTVKVKGNSLSYPTFVPIPAAETAVRHSEYVISYPEDVEIRSKVINSDMQAQESVEGKRIVKRYSVDNLPAVCRCRFTVPLTERTPFVLFAPATIDYHGTQGDMSSWESLGQWVRTLCDDCYALVSDAQQQVLRAVSQCATVREKVTTIYELMQDYTHYVSIVHGIGGYKPAKASMTWQLGFGDCKALTVLTKSMLKMVDIDSHEVMVSTADRQLIEGFPNFMQLDHMVLEVPIDEGGKRDTVWLECTDQTMEAGHVPDNVCHHQALEINDDGCRKVYLPYCCDIKDVPPVEAEVRLHADGSADVSCKDANRLVNGAKQQQYANKIGNGLFVPLSPLSHDYSAYMYSADCTLPMMVPHTICDHECVTIRMPEGWQPESLPNDISISIDSGSLNVHYEYADGILTADTRLLVKRGEYPASERKKLYELVLTLCDALQKKIVADIS